MYDAEVGSSGGRCESGPCTEVGEERVGSSRRTSSVVEVAMYKSINMISKRNKLKPKFRWRSPTWKITTRSIIGNTMRS